MNRLIDNLDELKKAAVTQDINQSYCGMSLLHYATHNIETCRWLLENGCRQVPNMCGQTPLYWSCTNKDTEMAKLLLKHGATTHDRCVDGRTCFHEACLHGANEIAELFLLQGATQFPDNDGRYPLHLALFVGNIQFARICAKYNVELLPDYGGLTPLNYAYMYKGTEEFIQLWEHEIAL